MTTRPARPSSRRRRLVRRDTPIAPGVLRAERSFKEEEKEREERRRRLITATPFADQLAAERGEEAPPHPTLFGRLALAEAAESQGMLALLGRPGAEQRAGRAMEALEESIKPALGGRVDPTTGRALPQRPPSQIVEEAEATPFGQKRLPIGTGFADVRLGTLLGALQAFQEHVWEPGGALLLTALARLTQDERSKTEIRYKELRAQGVGWIEAARQAVQEVPLPPGLRGTMEGIADPFTALPVVKGGLKATAAGGQALIKTVPKVGPAAAKVGKEAVRGPAMLLTGIPGGAGAKPPRARVRGAAAPKPEAGVPPPQPPDVARPAPAAARATEAGYATATRTFVRGRAGMPLATNGLLVNDHFVYSNATMGTKAGKGQARTDWGTMPSWKVRTEGADARDIAGFRTRKEAIAFAESRPAADQITPAAPAPATTLANMFSNLRLMDTYIDAAWKRIEAGQGVLFGHSKGTVEANLQAAWMAGRLKTRADVEKIVKDFYAQTTPPPTPAASGAQAAAGGAPPMPPPATVARPGRQPLPRPMPPQPTAPRPAAGAPQPAAAAPTGALEQQQARLAAARAAREAAEAQAVRTSEEITAAAPGAPPPVKPPAQPAAAVVGGVGKPPPPTSNLGKFYSMWNRGRKKPPRDVPDTYRKFQEQANDIFWGLRNLQTKVGKRLPIEPGGETDIISLITRGPGAANAGATRYDLTVMEMTRIAKGSKIDDLDTIIFANHAKEVLLEKGPKRVIAGGFRSQAELDDALAQLKARLGDAEYAKATEAAEVVKRTYAEERKRLTAAGRFTEEEAAVLAEKYPWYNPIRYVEYAEKELLQGRSARPFTVVGRGVQRLSEVGSIGDARSPMEVLGETLIRNEVWIQKNETAKAIITLALEDISLGVKKAKITRPVAQVEGKVIFRPTTQDIPGTLSFWEKGKREVYDVPDWIHREAVVLNQTIANPVSSFIGAMNGVSRAAFTTFSPPFVAANIANDTLTAFINRGIMPLESGARMLQRLRGLENDKLLQSFRLTGGFQARFYGRDARAIARDVGAAGGKVLGDRADLKRAILDAIPRAGEIGEQAPREALFRRQLNKTLPNWRNMTAEEISKTPQARKAAAEAVELTINFARGSYLVKAANPFVIFLNASMEGAKLPFRVLRDNPTARWRLAGVGAGLMGLTAYNLSYPEYMDVPNEIRWGSIIFMLPSKEKNAQGNPKANFRVIIPRTREWALFFGSEAYIMERLFRDSPQDFGEFTKTVAPMLSPISEFPLPALAEEFVEQTANYDFYWSSPVVSQELQSLPTEEQVQPWTSPTIAKIARTIGVSPVRLEHGVKGLFGGAAQAALSVTDFVADLLGRRVDPEMAAQVARYEQMDERERRLYRATLTELERRRFDTALETPDRPLPVIGAITKRFAPERGGQQRRDLWDRYFKLVDEGQKALHAIPEMKDLDLRPGGVGGTIQGLELSLEERIAYQQLANDLSLQMVRSLIANPTFQGLDDNAKRDLLQRGLNDAREAARTQLLPELFQQLGGGAPAPAPTPPPVPTRSRRTVRRDVPTPTPVPVGAGR